MKLQNLDRLAPWVENILYDNNKDCWIALFHPNTTIEAQEFQTIMDSLAMHVLHEIIKLVADTLEVPFDKIITRSNKDPAITDARQVAAFIISEFLPDITYRIIAQKLTWKTHCMVVHSRKKASSNEIALKIQRVYCQYPYLKNNQGIKRRIKTHAFGIS